MCGSFILVCVYCLAHLLLRCPKVLHLFYYNRAIISAGPSCRYAHERKNVHILRWKKSSKNVPIGIRYHPVTNLIKIHMFVYEETDSGQDLIITYHNMTRLYRHIPKFNNIIQDDRVLSYSCAQ